MYPILAFTIKTSILSYTALEIEMLSTSGKKCGGDLRIFQFFSFLLTCNQSVSHNCVKFLMIWLHFNCIDEIMILISLIGKCVFTNLTLYFSYSCLAKIL